MSKLLTICIPTHQGRAGFLIEAVNSILDQLTPDLWDAVEISISDNASTDGTAELVQSWQALYGEMFLYSRFERNLGGFPNFDRSVNQATGEFCWFLGSDDAFLDGAISTVIAFCRKHPGIAGFSVNKANYTFNMRQEVGKDHLYVLPDAPDQCHFYDAPDQIIANCAYAFGYMSAHIVRRAYWQEAVQKHGADYIDSLRHFSHSFVLGAIARDNPRWAWLPDYLVKQRTDNSCLLELRDNRHDIYLREVLEDMDKVWYALIPDERLRRHLRERFFLLYLNAYDVRRIKLNPKFGIGDDVRFLRFCLRYFHTVPQFWKRGLISVATPHGLVKSNHAFQVGLIEPLNRLRGRLRVRSRVLAVLGNVAAKQALRDAEEQDRQVDSRKVTAA